MTVTAILADGRKLEFPDGTDPAVVQRTVKKVLGKKELADPAAFQKQSALSSYRGEHPILATVGDVVTGMGGSVRGLANIAEKGYNNLTGRSEDTLSSLVTGEKPKSLGDKIWPKLPGSEGTGGKLVGTLLDPIPWAIGGGIAKVAPYMKVGGQGFVKGAQATLGNALTGGTTGLAIGGVSDEGDAASGGIAGATLSAAIPAAGVALKAGGKWLGKAVAPLTESGRVKLARKFLEDNIGPAKQKIIAALMRPSEIVPGSPTTAADRIAGATVGETDKFGSALVKAEDLLSQQSGAGISDIAKTIAAQQEAARAAQIADIGQTPQAIQAAINERAAVTGPMRETSLAAANTAGGVIPRLEEKIANRETWRTAALQEKGQLDTIAAQQAARGANFTPVAGQPRVPPRYAPQTAVAQEARAASAEVAPLIALRRAEADNAQWQIDYITSHGLKPLKAAPLLQQTSKIANTPGWRATDLVPKVMDDIRQKIASLTDANGVIDARDLDTIRRQIGVSIRKHAGETKDFDKKLAAKLEIQMKEKITQAIDDAGGGGYREYLTEYARRSEAIDRMKIGQELEKALTSATGRERGTVLANTVRKMEDELGTTLTPEQMAKVELVTKELMRNTERESLGSGVNVRNLFEISDKGKGSVHLPNLLSRPAMVTNWLMGQVGSTADDLIAQDMGRLMLQDPAAFATKYLVDVPPSQRQVVIEMLKAKMNGTGPYVRASLTSAASQNGEQ